MSTELHFEIILKIVGKNYNDIGYCCFFRSPLVKLSSFCLVSLYMSQILIRQMVSDTDKNEFLDCTMSIYSKNETTNDNVNCIFTKTLKCIKVIPDGAIRYQEDEMPVKLLLIHPTLYYLANNNTYNKILNESKAYDVLKSYENFLTITFGDIFDFKHIGADINKNNYIYEQILTRVPNDLSIPTYLINNYKINNSFSFYFFDPFYISENSENEITNFYINLFNKKKFKQKDTYKYADQQLMTKQIQIQNLSDIKQNLINKIGNRIILNDKDIRYSYDKSPKTSMINEKLKPTIDEFKLIENRKIKTIVEKSKKTKEYSGSSAITSIYCPDNVENGELRFNNAIQLMSDIIMGIHYYEISNCLPDFPQFGNVYNLEQENKSNYNLTPISINNIFFRKRFKEHYLYHLSKTMFIRFKND